MVETASQETPVEFFCELAHKQEEMKEVVFHRLNVKIKNLQGKKLHNKFYLIEIDKS